jgi:SAM-dependent methyltransferase
VGLGTVVEIGCGRGALGAWLARRDPASRRIATTADPDDAARARPHYDAVHVLPPDAMPPVAPGSADLVVLRGAPTDPAAAMRAAAHLLGPDGLLLVDLPNAGHWRHARALLSLDAEAPALPAGGMTREALLGAVQRAGLVPLDVPNQAAADAKAAQDFADRIAPALAAIGTDLQAWLRRATPSRWLLRAGRKPAQPLMLVAHVLKPVGGVNDVRIGLPLEAVGSWPGIGLRIGEQPEMPRLPEGTPRLLILHRRLLDSPRAPHFINHFRRQGCVIVQEFDDDPAHWPVIAGSQHFAFRGVHAVQTSTPRLEALFRRFNDEVAMFPNTVADLPVPANFVDSRRLTLFLGALRREQDMAPFLGVLNAVLAEAEGRLAVEVLFDQASFDALRTPHKRFWPLLPYGEYRDLMGRCELAFLPLADTPFNNCKSDLKFVEAGAHGLCCLASPVVYGATIRDGETGFIVRDAEALRMRLREMLAAPERARAVGAAARGWVREKRMLAGQVGARLGWYRGLWARRDALDAALRRRAPEVAAAEG